MSRQFAVWLLACCLAGIATSCCATGSSGTSSADAKGLVLLQVLEGQQHHSLRMLLADTPPTSCPVAMKRMFVAASKDKAVLQRVNQDCSFFVEDVSTCGVSCMCTFVNEVLNITRIAYKGGLFPAGDESSEFFTGAACGAYAREVFMAEGILPQHVLEIWNGSECLPVIAASTKCSYNEDDDGEATSSRTQSTVTAATPAASRTQSESATDPNVYPYQPTGTLGRKLKE